MLMFISWVNVENGVDNINNERVYNDNKQIIQLNQAKFAIIRDEAFDNALEQCDKSLMRIYNKEVKKINVAIK